MPTPARTGHCSRCGLTSVSDPCALCERENDRRIIKARARADREQIRVRLALYERYLA